MKGIVLRLVGLGVALGAGGCLIGGAIHAKTLYSAETAAWVQAVFSIFAIAAAAFIAIYVDQNAAARLRKDRLDEAEANYRAGMDALRVAKAHVQSVREHFNAAGGNSDQFDPKPRVASTKTSIEMLDFYLKRGVLLPPQVVAMITIKEIMTTLLLLLQEYDGGGGHYHRLGAGLPLAERAIDNALNLLEIS